MQEGATDARLRAVPTIKKKQPHSAKKGKEGPSSITSRIGSWVGSLNPWRKLAAIVRFDSLELADDKPL